MLTLPADKKKLWEQLLLRIFPRVKKGPFLTWFKDTVILDYQEKILIIGVPNSFTRDWLSQKFHPIIIEEAKKDLADLQDVRYEIKLSLNQSNDEQKVDVRQLSASVTDEKKPRKVYRKQEVRLVEGITSKLLNPKYTLDNFVVGQETRLAHAACQAVGNNPGGDYNPLFVYGGVGLGKTHLLQATGNEILKNDPDKIVVYVPSERFVNDIVEAIGKRRTKEFRDRYRTVDCLILDDIQFFADKDQSQKEFFHTFNELYDAGKQLILSSDQPPKELSQSFHERLTSRFAMGMIIELTSPGYETRLAILQAKCREHQALIPQEVLEFIATNIKANIRELEGILLQAMAQCQLENITPTVKLVTEIMKKLDKEAEVVQTQSDSPEKTTITSIDEVIAMVADYYRIPRSDLVGLARQKEIMMPRQIAMYLIRYELNHSFEKIGKDFGGKNHTTVMHACDKIVEQLKTDEKLVRDMNAIKKMMGM